MSGQDHVWILILLHGESVFLCLCVKGYVQGVLQLRTGLPTDSEGANTGWIFQACLCPHSSDTRWFRVSKLWRNLDLFFSSVIITFSLVRKVPSLRLGLGVTPSRITQDTTMPKLVAPQSRRKSECTVNIYSFSSKGLGPQMLFSHLQSFIWNIVWTP